MIFFIIFFALSPLLAEVPVFYEGRVIPFSTLQRELLESDLVVPAKSGAPWVSLSTLQKHRDFNFTYFRDEDFLRLGESETPLADLEAAFQRMGPHRNIPSQFMLWLEAFYLRWPFAKILLMILGFCLPCLYYSFRAGRVLFASATVVLTLFLAMRIAILGRPPVSNMEESLLFAGWIGAVGVTVVERRKEPFVAAGLFLGVLLLSLMPYPDPLPLYLLAPVLNSNFWLTTHVLLIVSSYGILIPMGILAHILLLQKREEYFPFLLKGIYAGTITLISGTLLGGVWAGLSWGRFWGWDPKESWAFISALVYLFFIHGYRMGRVGPWGVEIGAIVGMLSLSFTWYGVNYILASGLHSYGFGSGSHLVYYSFIAAEISFITALLLTRDPKTAKK